MKLLKPNIIHFFIKITKFCNLRCKYCYEFPYLGDKRKIELASARKMFVTLAAHYRGTGQILHFIWHGGEPFVLPPSYYRALFALQTEILQEEGILFENSVQTNLTILSADWLDALKENIFDSIGVSIDMVGDDRVNRAGKTVDDKVLANMQTLIDNQIVFGTITVLSAQTQPKMMDIYRFFCEIRTNCSLIPIQKNGLATQDNLLTLNPLQIVETYISLFEAWLTASDAVLIDPIDHYTNCAIAYLNPAYQPQFYDKSVSDSLFIINTDGKIYGDIYANNFEYDSYFGNIFEASFDSILASQTYQSVVAVSRARMKAICAACPYFGYCPGDPVGKGSLDDLSLDATGNLACQVVRPFLDYAVNRLKKDNLVQFCGDS
ncbi:MAG: hypothetical protein RL329_193 [Bacteroidota bacterium]|jgi:uncharacterized protein